MSEFIPHTITECVRELSKLVPGAEIGFISADASISWMRSSGSEKEAWSESFTIRVGNRIRVTEKPYPKHTKQHEITSGGLMDDKGEES